MFGVSTPNSGSPTLVEDPLFCPTGSRWIMTHIYPSTASTPHYISKDALIERALELPNN
jgi:hypothetical protein